MSAHPGLSRKVGLCVQPFRPSEDAIATVQGMHAALLTLTVDLDVMML